MHGRHRRRDEDRHATAASRAIAQGLASYANNATGNENAIGPHGIAVLARTPCIVTNGGPTARPRVNNRADVAPRGSSLAKNRDREPVRPRPR